ncbi:MAG: hypothetical protein IKZ42_01970 [Clostridiales bacterium]|nr:hypothetical protein [Clostridiales bacterium]
MTRQEFFKSPKMKSISSNIFSCAVLGYVIAGLTLYLNVIRGGNYASIPTVVVLVACSLLIHLLQSRVAAIVLTAYSALVVIITHTINGQYSGWWVVLIGVYAIIFTFKFQKAWQLEKEFEE